MPKEDDYPYIPSPYLSDLDVLKRDELDSKKTVANAKYNASNEPTIAPGMDDSEELEQNASNEEIEKGEVTNVTTLSFDEVDPS